jgi:hypothetical protein
MTGMKEGAGEDPFADDEVAESSSESEPHERRAVDDDRSSARSPESDTSSRDRRRFRIPYKFRRDGVQDGRDRVPLFLKSDTKSGERDALRELEDRFDDDVALTDLREALVRVGLDHLDEVEAQLEEWGYGMSFDE